MERMGWGFGEGGDLPHNGGNEPLPQIRSWVSEAELRETGLCVDRAGKMLKVLVLFFLFFPQVKFLVLKRCKDMVEKEEDGISIAGSVFWAGLSL